MVHQDDEIPVLDIKPLGTPKTIDRRTGIIRERLALGLTALVAMCIVAQFVTIWVAPEHAALVKEMVPMREMIVIYGTIIGFYFGSKQR